MVDANIQAYNAAVRKNEHFHVIERATGQIVGDSTPLPRSFAQYVVDCRDTFRTGSFYLQPV